MSHYNRKLTVRNGEFHNEKRVTRLDILASLEGGVVRTTGRIIELHRGKENAISKPKLKNALSKHGFKVDERQIRAAVHELRQQGIPLISSSGAKGYWFAESRKEVDEFIARELRPRAVDLFTSIRALESTAEKHFPRERLNGSQPMLFEGVGI